jgi:ATP-dependent DNA ligase
LRNARPVARFIEPMECLPVPKVPEGSQWTYEIKLDGYRLEAVKSKGRVTLYSRRGIDLTNPFKYIGEALESLPDETVIEARSAPLHRALPAPHPLNCTVSFRK